MSDGARLVFLLGALTLSNDAGGADQVLSPRADGTLADGVHGPFDGVADDWDWSFDPEYSRYGGSITLVDDQPPGGLEHRVVWEYNLSEATITPPVTAKLRFTLRGAPRFPAEPAPVCVFSYPADLLQTPEDFRAGPAVRVGTLSIAPYQTPTTYTLSVSGVVNRALQQGADKIGFRFQIDPDAPPGANQAFLHNLDDDVPLSKPQLIISTAVPGDADRDGNVGLDDFALFTSCMTGPAGGVTSACAVFDLDLDSDVDLVDLEAFLYYRAFFSN